MNYSKEDTVLKYLKVLQELKTTLDNTPFLNMDAFSRKHKVSKNFSPVLIKGGIVKYNPSGRHSKYEWITIVPNKHMAARVLAGVNEYNNKYRRKPHTKGKLKGNSKTFHPVKESLPTVHHYQMNLLFGLIKLKIKPVYK